MIIQYGSGVVNLPEKVLSFLPNVTLENLKVLVAVCSDKNLANQPKKLAEITGLSARQCSLSLAFWQGNEILAECVLSSVEESAEPIEKPNVEIVSQKIPVYTGDQLNKVLEGRKKARELIDELQRIYEKMFNPAEISIVMALLDYRNLSNTYILALAKHCSEYNKSVTYLEKEAYRYIEKGITSSKKLETAFREEEAKHTLEAQIRSLTGIHDRKLTKKEEKFFDSWQSFGYGIDIIKMAYEINVNAKSTFSFAYMNSILETWNAEGLKSKEDIEAYEQKKKSGQENKKNDSSFDADDFFNAALFRGFNEEKK